MHQRKHIVTALAVLLFACPLFAHAFLAETNLSTLVNQLTQTLELLRTRMFSAVATAEPHAPYTTLLDLAFNADGVLDNSPYHSPISTPADGFKTTSALDGYAYSLDDTSYFEVARDGAPQIYDHDQFSIVLNLKRAFATASAADILRIHTSFYVRMRNTGELYFDITNADGESFRLVTNGAGITDTNWHNIVLTYDSIDGKAIAYVDGRNVGETAVQGRTKPKQSWGFLVGNPWGAAFTGLLSHVEMRSDVVSPQEAKQYSDQLQALVKTSGGNDIPVSFSYITDKDLAKIPGAKLQPDVTVSNSDELSAAIQNAGSGDVIMLRDGSYGTLTVSRKAPSDYIVIAAAPGAHPVVTNVAVSNSKNIVLRGLTVHPETRIKAVTLSGSNIVFEDSYVTFADDTSGWSAEDWVNKTNNGIAITGDHIIVRNNTVKNVDMGIGGDAVYSLVSGNTIDSFRGDGMRGLGDYTIWENNLVKNVYDVDANHDDGFQSWSIGTDGKSGTGVSTGVIVRGNTFINNEDPNQPLLGSMQGIGMFDGPYNNWLIENNIVVVDHWHGISVYGGDGSIIQNNTVVDINTQTPGPSWIRFHAHKDGTPVTNAIIRNNIANKIVDSDPANITVENNVQVKYEDYATYFVDPAHLDFRLRPDAPIAKGIGASRSGSYISKTPSIPSVPSGGTTNNTTSSNTPSSQNSASTNASSASQNASSNATTNASSNAPVSTTNATSGASSGGGGGGGSSSSSSNRRADGVSGQQSINVFAARQQLQTLLNQVYSLLEQLQKIREAQSNAGSGSVSVPAPISAPVSTISAGPFTKTLSPQDTGTEVTILQQHLGTDSTLYPEQITTGVYDTATQRAVERFQTRYGIVTSGTPETTGYGQVGPRTRNKLNEIFRGASLETPSTISTTPSQATQTTTEPLFARTLKRGDTGEDVLYLQELLAHDVSVYPEGNITGYFTVLTELAVQRFQCRYNIVCSGSADTTGYGQVGPETQAAIQQYLVR